MFKYTNEELIWYLQTLAKELGRTPRMKDLNSKDNYPECTVYKDRFGSWNKALITASLKVKYQSRKWTREEIIAWLNYKYQELDRPPGIRDFDEDPKTPAKNVVRKLFGNWTNALRAANIPVRRFWSESELVDTLQHLYRRLNRTPTREDLRRGNGDCPSETPFVKKFGSYTAACLRAGLVPNDGRNNKIWKAWQKHCEEMARIVYGNVIMQFKNKAIGIPDIYVPNENLFIEVKTCGYKEFKEQVRRYCLNGNRLEFWCIFKGIETKNERVRYVYAEELAKRMKASGREDLAANCYQFIKNVFDEEQEVLV